MPLLHSYSFPFSITRLSSAHNFISNRTFSAFGLSNLTTPKLSHKRRQQFKGNCRQLKTQDTLVIRNSFETSSSISTLISARSNVHFKTINNRTANLITISKMSYQTEQRGSLYGDDFRMYFKDSAGNVVSPMHDIPLKASDNVYNMVVEVPRWSNAKLEISLGEKMNPVKQDIKKGKLRFVANCFPHHGYIWNYGALPQTWEDPTHMDPDTQANGDSDPVDICDIGSKVHEIGSIIQVKLLGTFAMIDEGETDWKLIGIDITDPMADKLNDIKDVEEHMPGLLAATVEWFKIYKMPDGKPANTFAFDSEAKDAAFAKGIVDKLHTQWEGLMSGTGHEGIERSCTSYDCSTKVSEADAQAVVDAGAPKGETKAIDNIAVNKWHHIQL